MILGQGHCVFSSGLAVFRGLRALVIPNPCRTSSIVPIVVRNQPPHTQTRNLFNHVKPMLLLCSLFPVAAHAGVIITLEATPPTIYPPVGYVNGEIARVDVYAQLDANSPPYVRLRMAQFDLTDSSDALGIVPVLVPDPFGEGLTVPFWNLPKSLEQCCPECFCGLNYFLDGSLTDQTPELLNITYVGLTTSGTYQIVLRQAYRTLLGSFDVTMPAIDGYFDLDLLNADESDLNLGADFRHGFGTTTDPGSHALTARDGTVTGGHVRFRVGFAIPEPATLTLLLLGTAFLTTKTRRARSEGTP
jgi:hypothetical protein